MSRIQGLCTLRLLDLDPSFLLRPYSSASVPSIPFQQTQGSAQKHIKHTPRSVDRFLVLRKAAVHIGRHVAVGLGREAAVHHGRETGPFDSELRGDERGLAVGLGGGSEEKLAGQLLRKLNGVVIRRFACAKRGGERGYARSSARGGC